MSVGILFVNIPRECGKRLDPFAIVVKKGEDIVGHIPR